MRSNRWQSPVFIVQENMCICYVCEYPSATVRPQASALVAEPTHAFVLWPRDCHFPGFLAGQEKYQVFTWFFTRFTGGGKHRKLAQKCRLHFPKVQKCRLFFCTCTKVQIFLAGAPEKSAEVQKCRSADSGLPEVQNASAENSFPGCCGFHSLPPLPKIKLR